jgi:hypothetical protein
MSRSLVVTWAIQPDLIPNEVGYIIPKPEEPSIVSEPPLFLYASEIIHPKKDTLQFQAFIQVLEMHDYLPLWMIPMMTLPDTRTLAPTTSTTMAT